MTRMNYITQFSKAVKWRLSYQEAEDVMRDYEELLSEKERENEGNCECKCKCEWADVSDSERMGKGDMCFALGTPAEAARSLGSKGAYECWLLVFFVLVASLVTIFYMMISYCPPLSSLLVLPDILAYSILAFFGVGILVSFVWFRPDRKRKDPKIPTGIFLTLGVILALDTALVMSVLYFFQRLFIESLPMLFAQLIAFILVASGGFMMVVGVLAIIKSRMSDRRWRAVYILALTSLIIGFLFLQILVLYDFNMDSGTLFGDFLTEELRGCATLGCVGLLFSGISLC